MSRRPRRRRRADEFAGLGDWSERYQYLIELGPKLPAMPVGLKVEANRVRGCQSTVFLSARVRQQGTLAVVEFLADSDSAIVSGLIALLQRLFSGQPAEEILDFDLPGFLARIGLGKERHDRSPEWAGRDGQTAPGARRLPGHATANRPER